MPGSHDAGLRPWVAYVGPFAFPDGGAAARRVLGMAETFSCAGFKVVVASGQPIAGGDDPGRSGGVGYVSLGERDAEHLPRPLRRLRYGLMGRRTLRWLESQAVKPDLVVLYSGYAPYLLRLIPWCRRNKIPLVFDAVEWYSPGSWIGGMTSPYYWNIELAMRMLVSRVDGVIAISTRLADYYLRKGVAVARIPPTLDVHAMTPRLERGLGGPLRLCYAGSPGTKDDLDSIVRAVLAMDPTGKSVVLDIAGIDEAEAAMLPSLRAVVGAWPAAVRVHGCLAHARAIELVRAADFSVLVRRPSRVSQSGFPTKFVESLSVGTPAIANLTGDLGLHLVEGITGIVCRSADPTGFEDALRRALGVAPQDLAAMRLACRRHAETSFDFRQHAGTICELVERLSMRESVRSNPRDI